MKLNRPLFTFIFIAGLTAFASTGQAQETDASAEISDIALLSQVINWAGIFRALVIILVAWLVLRFVDRIVQDLGRSIAEHRLAFRELGLAIGLHTIDRMQETIAQHPGNFTNVDQLTPTLTNLSRFYPVYEFIKDFWLEAAHRSVGTWQEHADINKVMLATCLAPDSYLKL